MKKFLPTAVAFLIIWAFSFVMILTISAITGRFETTDVWHYLIIGFSAALAGWLGPIVSKKFLKRF